ncbi:ABC transporter ATP-binding protein [Micromonospora sp. FIMYZ51]|uniref:ABC transporter ATP-binding protein n=1 Tax=Micromonospora sp. FIMYZ51 TaxID=3051832 RepID=UPI00311FE125
MLCGALWGSLWMCALMLPPYVLARAIDEGLRARDTSRLVFWVVVLVVLGAAIALLGLLRHRTMTMVRVDAAYRTVQVVMRHMTALGATLSRRVSVGELTYLQAGDISVIAQTLTITGPGVGAVVAYVAIAVLLFTISPVLAGLVVLGVPVLAVVVGPLLNRLRGVESTYRQQQGALTARAGDIVSGLRVLSGIGGRATFAGRYHAMSTDVRDTGYRVGALTSWVQAAGSGLPVLFLASVTWVAARMVTSGSITVGEMVAVYGYVAALLVPVTFLMEGADDLPRGLVAARRVVNILTLTPEVRDAAVAVPAPSGPAELFDPESGLRLPAGRMTALVGARSDEVRAVVDRMGRYVDSAVTWGGVPLTELSLTEVRRRILVADNNAHLFAGPIREAVSARAVATTEEIERAVWTAAANDIIEALPEGLDAHLAGQGRNLSGGQRQRLRLVRALLADPEVLMLVEPTSAVDAHTEATIADRVRAARQGRTTLLVGTSPLLLDRTDQVCYLVAGKVVAVGTHAELISEQPGYRALVYRGADADPVDQSVSVPNGAHA